MTPAAGQANQKNTRGGVRACTPPVTASTTSTALHPASRTRNNGHTIVTLWTGRTPQTRAAGSAAARRLRRSVPWHCRTSRSTSRQLHERAARPVKIYTPKRHIDILVLILHREGASRRRQGVITRCHETKAGFTHSGCTPLARLQRAPSTPLVRPGTHVFHSCASQAPQ